MAYFDLIKVFREYLQSRPEHDEVAGDENINLNNIKLKIDKDKLKWDRPISDGENFSRTVGISQSASQSQRRQSGNSAQVVGQVSSQKESENYVRVTLESGLVKGYNRTLEIPLSSNLENKLPEELRKALEINPGREVQDLSTNTLLVKVDVEQELGPGGATATVKCQEKTITAEFECPVIMKGKITARVTPSGVVEQNIWQIVKDLKKLYKKQGLPDSLSDFTLKPEQTPGSVVYTMKGEVEFKWNYEHNVQLN